MSTENIQPLDTNVIHELRSSLVISSFTQCLKELIHNALDANATNIDIFIDTDKFSLQVNDNGCGIQELSKIGQRHVTSKCHTISDMNQLKTFGFRGEALAAITNVSLTQIVSRHYSSKETFEGFWREGKLIGEIIPSKHTRKNHSGTNVIVRDLFYKFPVRRRQQSSSPYQHVVIIESVKRLVATFALCFYYVSFSLVDNTRSTKIMSIKMANSSLDIFRQWFGQDMAKHAKPIYVQEDDLEINGFFSTQSYPNKSQQYIYINNYFVPTTNELYKIVSDLFSSSNFSANTKNDQLTTSKGKGRFIQKYPIYMIRFTCPSWSNYEINSYLEMLSTQFSPFLTIVSKLKEVTTQFLKLAGFTLSAGKQQHKRSKRSTVKPASSISTSTVNNSVFKNSPYLAHSSSALSSVAHDSDCHSYSKSTGQQRSVINSDTQQPTDFITWWDPNRNELMYIDPRTGNSYYSSQMDFSSQPELLGHQNTIDRSSLKKAAKTLFNASQLIPEPKNISDKSRELFYSNVATMEMPYKLAKRDLQHIEVLGQIDKKFIAVKLLDTKHLVIIDQHAADERIKLEEMLCGNDGVATLEPVIGLDFKDSRADEFQWLTSDRILNCFKMWGIFMDRPVTNDTDNCTLSSQSKFFIKKPKNSHTLQGKRRKTIYVTRLPKSIVDRCIANHHVLKELILDHLYWIMEQTDEVLIARTCPKGIVEILKSKACRSAIMFNDELSLEQCKVLIKKLSMCNFPFQCAHGRPSAVPIKLHTPRYQKLPKPKHWKKFQKNHT
ncbi:MAG: hypothetical protein EXX96DRAFT_556133 [Benjaminiella poitrasii]|nr:MAG: hypothetical protein EXX96DRAFT_556133 [Benjaminiella poitrasii]